jgi:hypothetical protein
LAGRSSWGPGLGTGDRRLDLWIGEVMDAAKASTPAFRSHRVLTDENIAMNRSKGKYFGNEEVEKILRLLSRTDMSLMEIALRMQCSHSAIAGINRRHGVRDYGGRRSQWRVARQRVA